MASGLSALILAVLLDEPEEVNTDSLEACAGPLPQTLIKQADVAHIDTSCLATVPALAGPGEQIPKNRL